MKHYKDADGILSRLPDDLPYKASVKRVLMQAPDADVVEVVRCKDCKFCKIYYPSKKIGEEANKVYSCQIHWHVVRHDGFCSYGERKEK